MYPDIGELAYKLKSTRERLDRLEIEVERLKAIIVKMQLTNHFNKDI